MDEEQLKLRKETCEFYKKKYLGHFVTIFLYNGRKIIGIFTDVSPDHKLFIKGDYISPTIDPLDIHLMNGRPDRKNGGNDDGG